MRKILVNGIIAPFRAPKSARLYKKVWTLEGSPLILFSESLKAKLQNSLGDNYHVLLGMRYGNPSLLNAMEEVKKKGYRKIIVLPLYPQYASSTTGSILDLVYGEIKSWNTIPSVSTLGQFYDDPGFLNCFADNIIKLNPAEYDHILFSYHGLPLSHLRAAHKGKDCSHFNCTREINHHNALCYHATCYATTRLLAEKINCKPDKYTVCFQSRFSKNWLSPFADEEVVNKAAQGKKKLLIVSPAFVTDCLETIIELGDEYKELFFENGGEQFNWVQSLNDKDKWVDVLTGLITGEK